MKKAIRGFFQIIENEEISPGIFELSFLAPDIADFATPGQFVNVYLPGGAMILPRPISIAGVSADTVSLIYQAVGGGTKAMSEFEAGGQIEIMGPLGTGFFDYPGSPVTLAAYTGSDHIDIVSSGVQKHINDDGASNNFENEGNIEEASMELILIGGGVGIPPLYFAAQSLRNTLHEHVKITAYLGFRDEPWYVREFGSICDEVMCASEAGTGGVFKGNVAGLLDAYFCDDADRSRGAAALAIACGPRPMLAAVSAWCKENSIPLRVSLEERMGCGYGACAGCTCKTKPLSDETRPQNGPNIAGPDGIIKKKVCVHGPVFWENEVVW